jgi:hypothetical protein
MRAERRPAASPNPQVACIRPEAVGRWPPAARSLAEVAVDLRAERKPLVEWAENLRKLARAE